MSKRLDPNGLSGAFARRRVPTALDHLVPVRPPAARPRETAPAPALEPVSEALRREAWAAEALEPAAPEVQVPRPASSDASQQAWSPYLVEPWAPGAPAWRVGPWWRTLLRRVLERACGAALRAA